MIGEQVIGRESASEENVVCIQENFQCLEIIAIMLHQGSLVFGGEFEADAEVNMIRVHSTSTIFDEKHEAILSWVHYIHIQIFLY